MITVVLTGGGSGGHIMPILAVADALKRQDPDTRIVYIGEKGGALGDIPSKHAAIDAVYEVRAGKFRRYHGEGSLRPLIDLPKNARDAIYVLIGIWQAWRLLDRIRPDVIFSRGGYVSVPVCLGGKLRHVPYITHDSDSTPSLANRVIARWAKLHTVALQPELYPYPKAKTVSVGIPVSAQYGPVNLTEQRRLKEELHLDPSSQVVLITGGGNGAKFLNDLAVPNVAHLLKRYPKLHVAHLAGRRHLTEVNEAYDKLVAPLDRRRIITKDFVTDLYRYSGAADVVVGRGGANSLAEFAAQGKACILIPSEQLAWNVRNSRVLAEQGAVVELTEDQAQQELRFAAVIADLLDHPGKRHELGAKLAKLAHPDAAREITKLILDTAK